MVCSVLQVLMKYNANIDARREAKCSGRETCLSLHQFLSCHDDASTLSLQLVFFWMQDGNNLLMLAAAGGHYEASETFVDGYSLGLLVFAPKFWERCSPILTNIF